MLIIGFFNFFFSEILKLVLAGRMGEAIETTTRLYPGLLEHNLNLLFMLKCRQFVEMVNGSDSEVRCSSRSHFSPPPRPSTPTHASVIHSTKAFNGNGSSSSRWVFFPASFFEGSWYNNILLFLVPFEFVVCFTLFWPQSCWPRTIVLFCDGVKAYDERGGGDLALLRDLWCLFR